MCRGQPGLAWRYVRQRTDWLSPVAQHAHRISLSDFVCGAALPAERPHYFKEHYMLNISPAHIDAIKTNADTVMAFSNAVYAGIERLTTLNLQATRALLDESGAATSLMLEADGATIPAKAAKAIPEAATQQALAYFQGVQAVTTDTQQELTRLMTAYLAQQGALANPGAAWFNGLDAFKSLGQTVGAISEANRKAVADVTNRVVRATAAPAAKRA